MVGKSPGRQTGNMVANRDLGPVAVGGFVADPVNQDACILTSPQRAEWRPTIYVRNSRPSAAVRAPVCGPLLKSLLVRRCSPAGQVGGAGRRTYAHRQSVSVAEIAFREMVGPCGQTILKLP